jgi:hypothetical protein
LSWEKALLRNFIPRIVRKNFESVRLKISRNEKFLITCPNLKKIRKKMNDAIWGKKLKIPAISPAFKLHLQILSGI